MKEEKVFNYGVVCFADGLAARSLSEVRLAAERADIDDKLIREIKPRNTFIRAIRQLQKDEIIERGEHGTLCDKYADDDTVSFQFSQRFVEGQGVHYDRFAVVTFNKESLVIACSNSDIKRIAEKLYNEIQNQYSSYDLNAVAKKITEKAGCRRILLRDGVYFVPMSHIHVAEKIKKFFEALNFSFIVLPVSSASGEKMSIIRAVVRDVVQSVKSIEDEVAALKAEGNLTPRIARRRLEDLEDALGQYTVLASDMQTDLKILLKDASEAANALYNVGVDSVEQMIAGVQQGRTYNTVPLVHDLLSAAAEMESAVPIEPATPQPIPVDMVEAE